MVAVCLRIMRKRAKWMLFPLWIIRILLLCCQVETHDPGLTNVTYTEDGQPRNPVTLSKDGCRCNFCNISRAAYEQGAIENVAFNKPATSSSEVSTRGDVCLATNGVLNSGVNVSQSCFHSNDHDLLPWMQIDLLHVITFQTFTVFRRDIAEFAGAIDKLRMLGLDVLLDGRLVYSFPKYSDTKDVASLPHGIQIQTVEPVTVRYVRFQKRNETGAGSNIYIIVCNVDIWVCKPGTYGSFDQGCKPCPDHCAYACNNHYGCRRVTHNVSIMKKASQSQIGQGDPEYLVDGLTPHPQGTTCTSVVNRTRFETVWWAVDLGNTHVIDNVTITARVDCCGPEYLKGFYVAVTNRYSVTYPPPNEELCKRHKDGVETRASVNITCNKPLVGRYIFVITSGELHFCELEAFGFRFYYLGRGSSCNESSQFTVCEGHYRCVRGRCKSPDLKDCDRDADCLDGSLCDSKICRIDYNGACTLKQDACRIGTSCERVSLACKIKLGGSCAGHPAEYCPHDAVCDSLSRCRIKIGAVCQTNGTCAAGAECLDYRCTCKPLVSYLEDGQCKPTKGRTGSACTTDADCPRGRCQELACVCNHGLSSFHEDYSCKSVAGNACGNDTDCNAGLVCENSICKLQEEQICFANENHCKSGLVCRYDLCALAIGSNCTGKEYLCDPGSICASGICQQVLGQNCSQKKHHCYQGFCSIADKDTCRIAAGQPCTEHSARFCASGAFCENLEVCKIDFRRECTSSMQCREGLVCSASQRDRTLKCRRTLGFHGCTDDDDCEGGSVCDTQGHCRIPLNGKCANRTDKCLHGSQCTDGTCQCNNDVANSQSEKCEPKPLQIGGACKIGIRPETSVCHQEVAVCSRDGKCQCSVGFVVDPATLICGFPAGSSCSNKGSPNCTAGTECDVSHMCAIKVGESCAGDLRGRCKIGTLCDEDYTCRLDIHQNCFGHPNGCREGTECDLLNRCKRTFAGYCRNDGECSAGSRCSATNKCQCIEGVTTILDGHCVPVEGGVGGRCQNGCQIPFSNCNAQTGRCQCNDGRSPDPFTLRCAISVGQQCSKTSDCVSGLRCDPVDKICRIQVGQMCDGGKSQFCSTGLVCDFDSVCRLDLNGSCSGANALYCKMGTFCDILGQCGRGVGDTCSNDEKNPCIAGAICTDLVCTCDKSQTTQQGAMCEPHKGLIGGRCDLGCISVNGLCLENRCKCEENYTPNRKLQCDAVQGVHAEQGDTVGLLLGLVLGLLSLLLLILLTVIFIRLKHRTRAQKELEKYRLEELDRVQELKDMVSDVLEMEKKADLLEQTKKTVTVKKSVEKKSVEKKSVEKKPVEEKAVEEKSIEEKSVEEKSVEEKSIQTPPAHWKSPPNKASVPTTTEVTEDPPTADSAHIEEDESTIDESPPSTSIALSQIDRETEYST